MRSLRARLLLGYAIGSACLLVVSGWSILYLIESVEVHEFDQNLLQYARRMSIIAEQELGIITFEWEQVDPRSSMRRDTEDGNGHLFTLASKNAGVIATNTEVFPEADPLQLTWDATPAFGYIKLPDGTRARTLSYGFQARLDNNEPAGTVPEPLAIAVARRSVEIDRLLSRVRAILWGVGIPVILIGALGMYILLRHSLSGLTHVRQQLKTLAGGDLNQDVDAVSLPNEFLPLIDSINHLTNSLNDRINREKRFVAAASHELRTPIATIQSNLEIAERTGRTDPVIRSLEVSRYMSQVIERLLILNRLDHCSYEPDRLPFNIEEFLREAASPYAESFASRGISLVWDINIRKIPVIETDPVLLSFIISNIFSNIAAYAAPDSIADIVVHDGPEGLRLSFINHTDPVNLMAPDRLGEPFWRGDETRNLRDKHVGLGLAIAKAAATMLNVQLIVKASQPNVFCATIRMQIDEQP